jgi:hypothetical protein
MAESHWVTGVKSVSSAVHRTRDGPGNVRQLGTAVFTTYLFAFEATAALLVIAVVGAVLLALDANARSPVRRGTNERTRRLVPRTRRRSSLASAPSGS